MRERGNIWPILSVAAGAFFMLVIMPLIHHREKSSEMATVDAQVTIGDSSTSPIDSDRVVKYRWPDSEVPRTAERLRDVSAIAIAASANVVEAAMNRRPPRDITEIVAEISRRQLIPAEWLTSEPGVLEMPHATVYLRYLPRDLSVELISVPKERNDGPAILIRIPDSENTSLGIRYFESMQLDGIVYPPPFAPIAEIIASGWQPKPFKLTQIPDEQRTQLEQWSRTMALKHQ